MKLTRDDWLEHGMKTLAEDGFGALKADLLAKSLKVSRGSFYWHFRDLKEFHRALLDEWHERATQQVIAWLEQTASGTGRLKLLVRAAWTVNNRTERAVRAWATHSPEIARRLEAVDRQRIDYMTSLLRSAGLSPKQARARALFTACAYLGHMVLGAGPFGAIAPKDLDTIVELLQS
jgi:AcrR family transcriptional regulator